MSTITAMNDPVTREALQRRARDLRLHGLAEHLDEIDDDALGQFHAWLGWEERTRGERGLARRLGAAHLGRFKALLDYDWAFPESVDRAGINELMGLGFMEDAGNVVIVGPNGVGKTTIAQNIAHAAVLAGHTALFVTASAALADLAERDSDAALRRRLRRYTAPQLLVIDEIGYLSYAARQADLLFEIVSQRYETKPTIVTTNRPFAEWGEVFPNAACVTSLIDRLTHHAEIVQIDGDSWRRHEADERAAAKKKRRPVGTAAKSGKGRATSASSS